jgi:hypothetical protein
MVFLSESENFDGFAPQRGDVRGLLHGATPAGAFDRAGAVEVEIEVTACTA